MPKGLRPRALHLGATDRSSLITAIKSLTAIRQPLTAKQYAHSGKRCFCIAVIVLFTPLERYLFRVFRRSLSQKFVNKLSEVCAIILVF
ncbi:MAG: hypothetical protein AB1393_02455 [Candidatus Edwardsbacteria bacterium]